MTASGKCDICGIITGFYNHDATRGPKGWYCDAHQGKETGNCQRCNRQTETFVHYSHWPMGFFCEEHRPDKPGASSVIADVLAFYMPLGEHAKYEVYPKYFQDKDHPFNRAAVDRVRRGIAIWEPTTVQGGRFPEQKLNRAQRRSKSRLKALR